MKRYLVLFFVTLFCMISAKAQYQTVVIGETDNSVTLQCVGFGKNARKATADAEISAIRTVLFLGSEGTKFSSPLINESMDVIESNESDFFTTFYKRGYIDFIQSSIIVSPFRKKQKSITIDVCIRIPQLRSYLENHGIIRKFGL